jgi:hypothetical protein
MKRCYTCKHNDKKREEEPCKSCIEKSEENYQWYLNNRNPKWEKKEIGGI